MSSSDGIFDNPCLPICEGQESLSLSLTSPPGTDKMATLREELYGKEKFEMEIESRLRSVG
ncbi:hypothetical protein CIHG_10552 [Coccidioides immitis H538.4]|uniref:Uncharacterized protein n=1 Tax=Coccidioides immitis H538.4 TaxID=396776 RepID=A0A0J8S8M5_COCIT|nr:hypothetical protein CIHG_10552 [Coccidioides immitis H538.4]